MSILPEELIYEILSRLPAKSLLRFQCVSKAWFALIKDPTFINVHLKNNRRECTLLVQARHYEIDRPLNWKHYLVNFSNVEDEEPVAVEAFLPILSFPEIIDCCNGLVCIRDYKSNKIVILNPSIRKYKKLPSEPPFEPTVGASCFALRNFGFGHHPINNDYFALRDFGFGYDPINNDYKVLRIVEYFKSVYTNEAELLAGAIEVEVYSLKANSWRRVEDQWPYKKSRISSKPVYLNGALHWLVETATRGIRLLAFHLTTEKFQDHTLTLPVEPQTLEVLGVSLCVSGFRPETQGIDFWMMKEPSWSRHFTAPAYFRQVVFSTDDQTVLMVMDPGNDLFWYDIKKKTQSSVLRQIQTKIWTGTCVGSLVLLGGDI